MSPGRTGRAVPRRGIGPSWCETGETLGLAIPRRAPYRLPGAPEGRASPAAGDQRGISGRWSEGTGGPCVTVDLYSWDVQSGETHAGACGVSGDRGRALEALAEALRDEPPGARGSVWLVHLKLGRNPEYDYEVFSPQASTARRPARSPSMPLPDVRLGGGGGTQWNAWATFGEAVSGALPFEDGETLPERVVVLVQKVDTQARRGQGRDHLTQPVDELDRSGVLDRCLRVGVTARVRLVPDLWSFGEVVVGDSSAFTVIKGVGEGVNSAR